MKIKVSLTVALLFVAVAFVSDCQAESIRRHDSRMPESDTRTSSKWGKKTGTGRLSRRGMSSGADVEGAKEMSGHETTGMSSGTAGRITTGGPAMRYRTGN